MCQPTAPNPASLISQQTQSNKDTAIAQANLNMIDQTDAAGNKLQYQQNGTWADGTPRYSSTQTLGAAGQQLQGTNQGTTQNLANLANEQSGRLSGLLSSPIDFSAQKDYLEGLTSGALDKTWNKQAQDFETSLVNRGIRPGSSAYQQQMNDFAVNRSDSYNSANVNNYNTALQSQMALRQAPINEIMALAGGSQLQSPQFGSTPQTGIGGVDTAGIAQQGYANQMGQYNNNQGLLGGLFSAGANLLPWALSDRRLKRDVSRVSSLPSGLGVYEFKYLWSDDVRTGVMADEAREMFPNAVFRRSDGFDMVDYSRIG